MSTSSRPSSVGRAVPFMNSASSSGSIGSAASAGVMPPAASAAPASSVRRRNASVMRRP